MVRFGTSGSNRAILIVAIFTWFFSRFLVFFHEIIIFTAKKPTQSQFWCDADCPNGPSNCYNCHQPRLLTEEEKEQIQKSEHSGEELCGSQWLGKGNSSTGLVHPWEIDLWSSQKFRFFGRESMGIFFPRVSLPPSQAAHSPLILLRSDGRRVLQRWHWKLGRGVSPMV